MKTLKKQIVVLWLFLIVMIVPVSALELNFNNTLDDYFNNIEDVYSQLHFNKWTNDFMWVIFRQGSDGLDNDVNIELTSGSENFDCTRQIKWLYYNPQRGNSVWPLDQESLGYLQEMDSSYDDLTMTWGRYTECDGKGSGDVYGQITHNLGSSEYKLVAWVEFDDNNGYNQNFDNSLVYTENDKKAEGKIFDSWGGVAEIVQPAAELDDFSIPMIRNAELWEYYTSDPIEVIWLSGNQETLASISKGVLFINGDLKGTTWYVKNNDKVKIELRSASDYETVTSSVLTMGTEQATFYIVTQPEGYSDVCDLTISEKLRIYSVFKLLTDAYDNNSIKLESFLYTMKSMLKDRIANEEKCGYYDYLLDITDSYMMDEMNVGGYNDDQWVYVAPNCKQYEVQYDDSRQWYYSPDFVTIHYFISTETLEAFINKYNPGSSECGDTTYNDSTDREHRVAPNGKLYAITKVTYGYTSYDFLYVKTFDTLDWIRKYIDLNNPAIPVRNHEIDDTFEQLVYLAPNKKEYIIQRVFVSWVKKYMSYKFVTPKYFDSIDTIKDFIDKNNPA